MTHTSRWLSNRSRSFLVVAAAVLMCLGSGGACGGSMTPPDSMAGSSTGGDSSKPGKTGGSGGGSSSSGSGGATLGSGGGATTPPVQEEGWSDFVSLLVESDGSHTVGRPANRGPATDRDTGSKIVFFDAEDGTDDGEIYFWEDGRIVDADGSAEAANGEEYGTDPFEPNLSAIKPFRALLDNAAYRSSYQGYDGLAANYPDWYLFRRGQTHTDFELQFAGGRSSKEPMLVGAYGPTADGRATIQPGDFNPLTGNPNGKSPLYFHLVMVSLDIVGGWSTGAYGEGDVNPDGEPSSAFVEDCAFVKTARVANRIMYPPRNTTIRRSVIGYSFNADSHNQGFYSTGNLSHITFDEVIFYKNGYKTDPKVEVDPVRDVYSRNVYEGGGDRMGNTYRGIISADGGSGGPQMRLGGLIENSLVVEGYWFSSTNSNSTVNEWISLQEGQSAVVRNNVQLSFRYSSPADPDSVGESDRNAQVGDGYTLQGSSFGATVEGNIISGAMLLDELDSSEVQAGITITPGTDTYADGQVRGMRDNKISGNIVYRADNGLRLNQNWSMATGIEVFDNVFVARRGIEANGGSLSTDQLKVYDNRFYIGGSLPDTPWVGDDNEVSPSADAAESENWPDPDRTVRRYVTEELGLELLDWDDDPFLDPDQGSARADAGEEFDPTGLRTFMAVAMNMRRGGKAAAPTSGKPDRDGDYEWDSRFTGPAVVNWIREGFGLDPVTSEKD